MKPSEMTDYELVSEALGLVEFLIDHPNGGGQDKAAAENYLQELKDRMKARRANYDAS